MFAKSIVIPLLGALCKRVCVTMAHHECDVTVT